VRNGETALFLLKLLAYFLIPAAGVVSLLALLSKRMLYRPLIGLLVVPIAGGSLLALCALLIFFFLFADYGFALGWGVAAAIVGAPVGLVTYIGVLLWKGQKRSRWRTILGVSLLLTSWLLLGSGLVVGLAILAMMLQ